MNILNRQIIEQYCKWYNIEVNYNITPEFQNNWKEDTLAMWLTQWQRCVVPKQWMHDYNIKNSDGETLKDLMIIYHMPIPYEWQYEQKMSIFDQAYFGIIPDITSHKSEEQDKYGFTVAILLGYNNISIPKEWHHNPKIQNNYGQTVAMILVKQQIVPPKQWMHDNTIKSKYNETLKDYLEIYQLPVPYHWNDDMTIFDKACYGEIPDIQGHKSNEQNEDGFTVAMILILNKIDVPQQWQHNPDLQNNNKQTVFDICIKREQQPPQWCCKEANWQNVYGYTQAMICIQNNIEIPVYLYHDPSIQNNDGYTVAMYQAKNRKIPDKQWIHDKYLRCKFYKEKYNKYNKYNYRQQKIYFYTVQNILQQQHIEVPEQWKYTPLNEDEDNQAMIDARNGIIPELNDNDPEYQNTKGETVATILVEHNIIPPQEWIKNPSKLCSYNKSTIAMMLASHKLNIPQYCYHDPTLTDMYKYTTAMYNAIKGQIPDKAWEHDPILKNVNGDTVAMILASNGVIPPKEWMHDINLKNSAGKSIKSILYNYDYIYKDGQFVLKYKTQILDDTCQICFNQGKQEFISTKCNHNICKECFKQLIKKHKCKKCPICRMKNWTYIQQCDQDQYSNKQSYDSDYSNYSVDNSDEIIDDESNYLDEGFDDIIDDI